jgi:hypothetical protein
MIFLVFEQLEESNRLLNERVKASVLTSEKITNAAMPKLLSLEECLRDLHSHFYEVKRGETITVRHIALDMVDAWRKVESLLSENSIQANIDYRVLMITKNHSMLGPVDEEVKEWCKNVGEITIPRIKRDAPKLLKQFKQSGRRLQITGKEYAYSPFLHGFEIQGPVNICYMSICRWIQKEQYQFDWGEEAYFRIIKPTADPVQNDLHRIFSSSFDRHWYLNPQTNLEFDSQ